MSLLLAGWLMCAGLRVHAAEPEQGVEVTAPVKDEDAGQPLAVPPLEDPPSPGVRAERTAALASQLRCPVCQGLSIGASPSETARRIASKSWWVLGIPTTRSSTIS